MIALLVVSLLSTPANAQCSPPQTAQAVLDCALERDPGVRAAKARLDRAEAGLALASQRPNPEFEGKGTWDDSSSKAEVDLVHTIETGGRRPARLRAAGAERQAAAAEVAAAQAETALRTVTALYRLRQLRAELALIDETLTTFSRVGEQLRSRPRLAPEQEVARSVFELAGADYRLKRAALSAEQTALLSGLEASLGVPLALDALPVPESKAWPALEDGPTLAAPELTGALAALEAARAGRLAARAQAWPELRLGPSLEAESDAGSRRRTLGLNLALALPLYQRNAGGREQARRGEQAASLEVEAVRVRLRGERQAERARYEAAVKSIEAAAAGGDARAEHERIEDFFQRGLISSALVIEAHRQMFEFTRDLHEHEAAAARALWRVRAIDGRVLGGRL